MNLLKPTIVSLVYLAYLHKYKKAEYPFLTVTITGIVLVCEEIFPEFLTINSNMRKAVNMTATRVFICVMNSIHNQFVNPELLNTSLTAGLFFIIDQKSKA